MHSFDKEFILEINFSKVQKLFIFLLTDHISFIVCY